MNPSASLTQNCPTCGRRLRIRVAHLRERLTCQHCHAEFLAQDQSAAGEGPDDWGDTLLSRADELLALLSVQTGPA